MQVLEENSTNWLILTENGSTTTKTKASSLNQLLYSHDLFGLLERGDEIWTCSNPEVAEPTVTIIPDDEAKCYTLRIGDHPDLTLGANHKSDLLDALVEVYETHNGNSVAPILDLYDSVRENMVRADVLKPFARVLTDKVEERDDGWFINGHLLLTYEGEFYHSDHTSRTRSGRVIGEGMARQAYKLSTDAPTSDMRRSVTVDGQTYRLTDSETEFVAKAMWAIENTPDRT